MKCGFGYGAVLKVQREFSLEEIYGKLAHMKKSGMNQVVVWPSIYWWEDRSNPAYPFYTGQKILEYAEQLNMNVIMELEGQITCLEYAPDFIMKEEYYPVDRDGHRVNRVESYGPMNYSHPEVRQLLKKYIKETVNAYKGYSSLYGYDIYNETRFESYDIYTLYEFRKWLERKYGTIEGLNASWERSYYDWSQIQFSYWMWASVMPVVDYNQFKKDYMAMILNSWKEMIKETAPGTLVIADNVYSSVSEDRHYHLPQDDWSVAASVDEFGISLYPKNDSVGFVPYRRWMTLSEIHCAAPFGNFWISELQSHNVSMFNPFSVVYEKDINWWNMEAIFNGAKGIIFWKWDPFMKGVQTLGRGLVDVKGRETKRLAAVKKIAGLLQTYKEEFSRYQPGKGTCAILYDALNHDFTKAYAKNHGQKLSDSIYLDSMSGLYQCLWQEQIYPEFVTAEDVEEQRLGHISVLFITSQVYMTEKLARGIRLFAEAGGTVICDGRFGMVNETGYVYENLPGGPMHEILGISYWDIEPENLEIAMKTKGCAERVEGYYERQLWEIDAEDAKVWGEYADGFPAIVEMPCKKGSIVSISSYLWYGYFCQKTSGVQAFAKYLGDRFSLRKQYSENGEVKVGRLKGSDGELVGVFRYEKTPAESMICLEDMEPASYIIKRLDTGELMAGNSTDHQLKFSVSLEGDETAVFLVKQQK